MGGMKSDELYCSSSFLLLTAAARGNAADGWTDVPTIFSSRNCQRCRDSTEGSDGNCLLGLDLELISGYHYLGTYQYLLCCNLHRAFLPTHR